MFSVYEDTILDPFLGTGTTITAAMATGRNSIGVELTSSFKDLLIERFNNIVEPSNKIIEDRIENHLEFVRNKSAMKNFKHQNRTYCFPVVTSQEVEMAFHKLKKVTFSGDKIEVNYESS
jgi:tRNA G10  N-methylase Trm11